MISAYILTFNISSKWSFKQWWLALPSFSSRNAACNPEGRNVESKETSETSWNSWRISHIDIGVAIATSIHVMYIDKSFKLTTHLPFFQNSSYFTSDGTSSLNICKPALNFTSPAMRTSNNISQPNSWIFFWCSQVSHWHKCCYLQGPVFEVISSREKRWNYEYLGA